MEVTDGLYQLDIHLLRIVNTQWTHPVLDTFMAFISDFGLLKAPLILAGFCLLLWGKFRGRVFIAMLLLCVLAGDAGISNTFKKAINRPRPYQAVEHVRHVTRSGWGSRYEWSQPSGKAGGGSMPSSHVCNNVAIAILITLIYGGVAGRLVWIWAFLIAYSRVYLGHHYPSDVLAGAVLALVYTPIICFFAQRLWQWGARRWIPDFWKTHPTLFPAFSCCAFMKNAR